MRHDLDILRKLFLPLLEEMGLYTVVSLSIHDVFWIDLNDAVTGNDEQLQEFFTGHGVEELQQYAAQIEILKKEYIAWNAQGFCKGETNPTIEALTGRGDAAFMEEVAFQKNMLAAITLAARAQIKNELVLDEEFAGTDISPEEITAAFDAQHQKARRDKLRQQLKQWDEEQPAAQEPVKRRKRRAIPLLFMRFAAAAAVGTVATVGIVKVYNKNNRDNVPTVNYNQATDSNNITRNPASKPDTTASNSADTTRTTIANTGDTQRGVRHLPQIILKGNIIDTATNELVTDVEVTMVDDKGKKQTVLSKDGNFKFRLPLHRDITISGKKEHYRSARLSLSTKDVKDTDADDVIEGTLRLIRD